jgi:hypothetical protein
MKKFISRLKPRIQDFKINLKKKLKNIKKNQNRNENLSL